MRYSVALLASCCILSVSFAFEFRSMQCIHSPGACLSGEVEAELEALNQSPMGDAVRFVAPCPVSRKWDTQGNGRCCYYY